MGELTTQLSSWPGSLDTALALSDGPGGDSPKASHINGVIDAVLKLQADLGTGLKGSVADLKTRLAANISALGGLLSGTVFPGSPTPLQLFWRTDTKQLHIYDDALGQWQRVDSTNVHSALSGLLADDHPQYAEIAEAETISGAWNFTTAPSLPAGSIGSTEIADGSIADADVSPSAGIADTKLETLATPGKVADTALSANVALLDLAQAFTQNQTIQGLFPQFIAETTGQTAKGRMIEYLGRAYLTHNAYRDGTGWQRDDTALSSWAIAAGGGSGDIMIVLYAPAGTGTFTFNSVFQFDSAGKMVNGTVPLASLGFNGSVTTASLAVGGFENIAVTHNLGTDDVMVIMRAEGTTGTAQGYFVYAKIPNGESTTIFGGAASIPGVDPTTPIAGNVTFGVHNRGTIASVIHVEFTIMRRT